MKITQNREACDAQHQGAVVRKGWQVKKLGEVCEFSNGLWKGDREPFINVGVIRNTNFTKEGALDETDIAYLDVEVKKFEKRRLQFGDIILEKSGGGPKQPVGRVALFDKDDGLFSFSNFTSAIRVKNAVELDFRFLHKYLFWTYLSGVTETMQSHSTGIRNLDGAAYKLIQITIPPLAEQHRIVAILDEAFESIATAKANTEKNLQNARVLFESHLESIFTERGEGWVEKRLGDVCAIFSTLVDPRKEDFIDLIHVGAGNIQSQTGVFVDLKTAREEGLISGKFLFDESMVLYSKIRPYLMKAARPDFNGLCSADMYPLSPLHNQITRDYLFHLLLSKPFTDYAIRGSARAGMPKVNREHLFEFRAWLPSVKKQMEQTAILDALHDENQRLAYLYQKKLTALDDLKKSLLHQAFSGAL